MKLTKRIASILVALIMVFAMTTTAMAYTIETTNDHTYEVYQIFTGDLSGTTLSNVVWGKNGTGETGEKVDADLLAELEAADGTDSEQLAVIKEYVDLDSDPYDTVSGDDAMENVPAGYYLIKDVDGSFENEYDSYTLYIVKIVGDVTIDPKSDVPSVIKKVDDKNDSTTAEDGEDWVDSADYDIGDSVPFQITATLPGNYSDYEKYAVTFVDTMDKGLSFDADKANLTVSFGEEDITSYFTVTTVATEDGGTILTVTCDDLKQISGITDSSQIVLTYSAVLDTDAALGAVGNKNIVKLQFSNDPNWTADPDGDPTTPPPEDHPDEPKGETPEDTVIVFTYKTVINKVDGEGNALSGAAFKLEKKLANGSWEPVDAFTAGDATSFEFVGLDDGTYKLTETATPAGYNAIDPIEFTITATHTEENANPVLESLSGASVVDGVISFEVSLADGSLTTSIVNNSGSILPETGGIGTTIFYIVGGVLVVLAIVLLVTKKRMSNTR